jgi:hypothetical protein
MRPAAGARQSFGLNLLAEHAFAGTLPTKSDGRIDPSDNSHLTRTDSSPAHSFVNGIGVAASALGRAVRPARAAEVLTWIACVDNSKKRLAAHAAVKMMDRYVHPRVHNGPSSFIRPGSAQDNSKMSSTPRAPCSLRAAGRPPSAKTPSGAGPADAPGRSVNGTTVTEPPPASDVSARPPRARR